MVKEYIVPWNGIDFSCRVETTERRMFSDYNYTQVYYQIDEYRLCLSELLHCSCYGTPPHRFIGYMNREGVKDTLRLFDKRLAASPTALDWMDSLYLSENPKTNQAHDIDYNQCHVMWQGTKGAVDLSVLFHENIRSEMELYLRYMGASTQMISFMQTCVKNRHYRYEPLIVSLKQLENYAEQPYCKS